MNTNNTPPMRCPGCLDLITPRALDAGGGQKIIAVECPDCGVMFNRTQPSDETVGEPVDIRSRHAEKTGGERVEAPRQVRDFSPRHPN